MKLPILVSYAYARNALESPMWDYYINSPDIELLLDCGAFTAKTTGNEIKLSDYCDFLDQWGDRLFAYLALDVVGDPVGTEKNLQEMLGSGYKPVPVHVLGDDQKRLDELFELSDYVALAGLKRPGKGHAPKSYVRMKHEWAAGRNVHWLGYVVESMIAALKPFSVDSSSWGSGFMFGTAKYYLGGGRWSPTAEWHDRQKLMSPELIARMRELGIDRKQFNTRSYWKAHRDIQRRSIPNVICVDSWVRYCLDIRLRYGTRVFMAVNLDPDDGALIREAVERCKKESS